MADESGKRDDENKDAPDDGADKSGDGQSGIPEVEAELVSEQAAATGSGEAFDADAPKDQAETGAASEVEPGPAAEKPARKSSLTPGVMLFLAFVVVALIAFAVWRFAPFGAASSNGEPAEVSAAPDAAPAGDEKPAPDEEAGQSWRSDNEPADPKIANAPAGELKTSPTAVEEEESGALPPVSDEAAEKIQNMAAADAKQAPEEAVAEEETEEEASAASADDQSTEEVAQANAAAPVEDETVLAEAETESVEQTAENEAVSDDAAPQEEHVAQAPAQAPASDPVNAQRVAALEAELAALRADHAEEKRTLENELAQARRNETGLNSEIERLRADLADAEAARDEAVNEQVETLRAEVRQLRREQANVSARQMRASFALAALSRAVDQGDPFAEELEAVEEFAPGETAALAPYAAEGVATEAALRIGFDAAAREALSAAGRDRAGGGLKGLFARAQGLISVRPAEPVAGDAPGAILSRAENALEEGDLAFALGQLEDLPPVAKEAMAAWMADAKARAEAQVALAALQTEIPGETG